MPVRFLIFASLVFFSRNFFAQDQLFKKDNSKLEVKVLEVTPNEVKYKLKSNPDGPLYIVNKSDVALLIYANGEHETFPESKQKTEIVYAPVSPFVRMDSLRAQRKRESTEQFNTMTKKKNVVFLNTLALLNGTASLSYLREFGNGLFSIHLPVSASFAEPSFQNNFGFNSNYYYGNVYNYRITHKTIDAGMGIYFHTSGKHAITHFIGPLIRFAQYNGTFYTYDYSLDQWGNPITGYSDKKHGFVLNESYAMINNGILFRITPAFNMMLHAAIGTTINRQFVANDPNDFKSPNGYYNYNQNYTSSNPVFNIGLNVGYRF